MHRQNYTYCAIDVSEQKKRPSGSPLKAVIKANILFINKFFLYRLSYPIVSSCQCTLSPHFRPKNKNTYLYFSRYLVSLPLPIL